MKEPLSQVDVQSYIYRIRGQQVMLDTDLAQLYGVATKNLNKAVQRNLIRFPQDFMFRLTVQETTNLRFQFGTSKILRSQFVTSSWGGRRYLPYAFTEEGVAMLSSVLRSPSAVLVNVAIMRAFVKLRHALATHKDLAYQFERLEGKVDLIETDVRFIREDIQRLKNLPEKTGPSVKGFLKE